MLDAATMNDPSFTMTRLPPKCVNRGAVPGCSSPIGAERQSRQPRTPSQHHRNQPIQLVEDSTHRAYQLQQNGELVGTLERPSVWSSTFIATTAEAKWIFRRSGFWGGGIEIVDAGSEQPIAIFKGTWTYRGMLRFSDGQTLTLECKGFCHPTWSLRSQTGEAVLSLHAREKTAEVDRAVMLPEGRLRLLVLFTLYRLRQAEEDAAAVAVAAAAS
jgi:hypothetical protein